CVAVVGILAMLSAIALSVPASELLPAKVEFNRHIRPILSNNCFQCHGPDSAQRKADLRLDQADSAFAKRGDHAAIVPGNLEKSELWRRVNTTEKLKHMPPAKTGKQLTEHQLALLKRWIEQGAKYEKHWSFTPPQRPAVPKVKDNSWPRNAI